MPLNEPEQFANAIEKVAGWGQEKFDETAYSAWQYAQEYIESPAVKEKYLQLFS